MRVTLRLGEPYWREVGARRLEFDLAAGTTVADLLQAVEGRFPDLLRGDLPPTIFLNDDLAGPKTPLAEASTVMLVWSAAGG